MADTAMERPTVPGFHDDGITQNIRKLVGAINSFFRKSNDSSKELADKMADVGKAIEDNTDAGKNLADSLTNKMKYTSEKEDVWKTNLDKLAAERKEKENTNDYNIIDALNVLHDMLLSQTNKILESSIVLRDSVASSQTKTSRSIISSILSLPKKLINNRLVDGIISIKDNISKTFSRIISFPSNLVKSMKSSISDTFSKVFSSITAFPKAIFGFLQKRREAKLVDERHNEIMNVLKDIKSALFLQLEFDEEERKRLLRERHPEEKKKEGGFLTTLMGLGASLIMAVVKKIKDIANAIWAPIKALSAAFKVKFPKLSGIFGRIFDRVRKVFSPITKILNRVKSFFSRIFSSISKIGSLFKPLDAISKFSKFLRPVLAFAKGIPIIGWVITGITSVIDFFKGFMSTEGSFFDKIIGGFKGLFDGLGDIFLKLPLNLLEWVGKKVAGIFGLKMPEGWSDKTYEFIKNIGHELLDWLVTPFKDIWDFFFGDKKEETNKEDKSILDSFKDFFVNFGSYVNNWIKKNPVAKGANYLWEKITGKPLFDSGESKESNEPKLQKNDKPIIEKDDKISATLGGLETMKENKREEREKKNEEEISLLKDVSEGISGLTDKISAGLSSAISTATASMQNVYNSAVNMVSGSDKNEGKNIPEGIESLGLMLKNSTWGF